MSKQIKVKLYLSKFKYGNKTHIGLSHEDTRNGATPNTFLRPYSPCCNTIRSQSYPISKRLYTKEELLEIVTCDVCKERLQNIQCDIITGDL